MQHQEPWAGCVSVAGEQGRAARDWYAAHNMSLFTWSSLAGGFFSGRFRRDNLDSFSDGLDVTCVHSYCYEDNFQRLERAESLGQKHSLTLTQIAMAYVMSQPLNIYALVGCRTVQEFRDNTAAIMVKLTPDEIAWLEVGTPEPAT